MPFLRNSGQLVGLGLSRSALILALAAALPAVAHAQERGSKLEAEKEVPPKLEPIGGRVGAFRVFAGGSVTGVHDDNVYAQETGEKSDTYVKVSPTLRLNSDTSRYKFNIVAGLDRYEYADLDNESRTDWNIGSDVAAELLRDTTVTLNAGYRRGHEERGAPDSAVTARSPVRYNSFTVGGGMAREVGRLQARTILDYEELNYQDGRFGSGALVNNDDRDRKSFSGGGELSYEISPGYRAFGRALYDKVAYRLARDDNGYNRDGNGYRLTGGVNFDITNVIQGGIFGGYMRRNYKDVAFKDYGGIAYGANVRWAATRMTIVSINANRQVQETTQIGYRGFVSTDFSIRVDHELMRSVLLNAGGRYSKNKYLRTAVAVPGLGALNRDDDIYMLNAGVEYTLNRMLTLSAGWDWSKRASNMALTDYSRNKVSASLKISF